MKRLKVEEKKPIQKNEHLSFQDNDLVAIGRVLKARGLCGELKVESLSDVDDRFKDLLTVFLELKNGSIVTHQVETAKKSGNVVIVKLKDIDDRNTAESFHGAYMCVDRQNVAILPDDSYYVFELEGMEVLDPVGEKIGRVIRVERYPANDVIVVGMDNQDVMIPAVKKYILDINSKEKYMTVNIPEGLPVYPKGKR